MVEGQMSEVRGGVPVLLELFLLPCSGGFRSSEAPPSRKPRLMFPAVTLQLRSCLRTKTIKGSLRVLSPESDGHQ